MLSVFRLAAAQRQRGQARQSPVAEEDRCRDEE